MAYRLPPFFYRVAYQLIRLYVFIFRPRLRGGVLCLVEWDDKLLLVRHSYGSRGWNLPGGNMSAGESPEQAARRELKEEVGIEAVELRRTAVFPAIRGSGRPPVSYFHAVVRGPQFEVASGEIQEAGWFTFDETLRLLQPRERYVITKFLKGRGRR